MMRSASVMVGAGMTVAATWTEYMAADLRHVA